MPVAHQYLHLIEYKDIETYNAINKIFRYVNDQEYEPTREQREIIEYLLREFEKVHKWDKNSKGKPLIQYKYKKRCLQIALGIRLLPYRLLGLIPTGVYKDTKKASVHAQNSYIVVGNTYINYGNN